MMELPDVAAELYGLIPSEFTAARAARVKNARAGGDAALAKAIGGLAKPSTGAAVVNLLGREQPGTLEQLFELGSQLRAAQEELDRTELQRLGRARQELVAALARNGKTVAENLGMTVSASALRDAEQTLQAALADPPAEAAVRSGALIRALVSTGFEPVDLTDAVAIPLAYQPAGGPGGGTIRKGTGASATARARAAREKAGGKRREEAQRAAGEAARQSEEAEARLADVEKRIDELEPRRTSLDEQLTELERQAAEVRTAIAAIERETDRLARERTSAADRVDTALARERRARDRLDALE
jgi:hypothetical protein